jgi:hypothetical protein
MTRSFLVLLLACAGCATPGQPELNPAEFSKVVPGKTSANEVRALLGAPSRTLPWTLGQGETWAYPYRGAYERRVFWVEVSREGVVRATSDALDFDTRFRF